MHGLLVLNMLVVHIYIHTQIYLVGKSCDMNIGFLFGIFLDGLILEKYLLI